MSKVFIPAGSATGEGWQYQIERNGHFTAWTDWAIDLAFDTDPEGGDMRTGVLYWAYAQNPNLPANEIGSVEQALVASFKILDDGTVVPGSEDGAISTGTGSDSLAVLIAKATPAQLRKALLDMLEAVMDDADSKEEFCLSIGTCEFGAPDTIEWIVDEKLEEATLVPDTIDWIIDGKYEEEVASTPPEPTGLFRIKGPSSIFEGASGQYGVESELTNGNWIAYTDLIVWSAVNLPSGCSINSAGLLSIGTDTITADRLISVQATIGASLVEYPVTLANVAPMITGYRISGPATLNEGATSANYSVLIDYSDGTSLVYTGAGTFSLPGNTTSTTINLGPYSASVSLTSAANSVSANANLTLRFTLPNSSQIEKPVLLVNADATVSSYTLNDATVQEGGFGEFHVTAHYSDGTSAMFALDGSWYELVAPYPDGMFVGYGNVGAIVSLPENSISGNVNITLRYNFPTGFGHAPLTATVFCVNHDPAPAIDKIATYTPQGWHGVYSGNLSENIVLLVNVLGVGAANAVVQARYAQSRNDATFGNMVKIDYSNNPSPNVLPAGYTHYLVFNDETFSTGLKDFQVKIPAISGSQKNATWSASATTADHVTQQIFP